MSNSRPESYYDNGTAPGTPYYGGGSRRFGPRNNSDPALYGNNINSQAGVYPSHVQQPSYDTVGTLSNGSHITDQWGNSTDPSSENSSIDRAQQASKSDVGEIYGFSGFGGGPHIQGPILEEHGQGAPGYGQPGYGQSQMSNGNGYAFQGNSVPPKVPAHGGPMPPPKESAPPRVPIRLGANNPGASRGASGGPPLPPKTEKRKSWLGKRFSRG